MILAADSLGARRGSWRYGSLSRRPLARESASTEKPSSANPSTVTGRIPADRGGVLTTPEGIELSIPPGALADDTEVTVRALSHDELLAASGDLPDLYLTGAIFEPDGLVLRSPATARFPLPANWPPSESPTLVLGRGADPELALPDPYPVKVEALAGSVSAEVAVHHFSTWIMSKNCHAGTIRRILEAFEKRGCPRDRVLEQVHNRYNGEVDVDLESAVNSGRTQVQAVLDAFFDDFGSYDKGNDVPASVLTELADRVRQGRLVALAFHGEAGPWPAREEPHAFYPNWAFEHTSLVQADDHGQVDMCHTITQSLKHSNHPGMKRLVADLGGELQYTHPFADLNRFRSLRSAVAFEELVCDAPGCLSSEKANDYGLNVYPPLAGYTPDHPRMVAYPAVHIYLEKENSIDLDACAGRASFPDPTRDWTVSLTFTGGFEANANVISDPNAYNKEWVEVRIPVLPSDPAAWDPLDVTVSVTGGAIEHLQLYTASNNWDPASRSTSYTEFVSGDTLRMDADRYYWLDVWTNDPALAYDYTTVIFRLVGESD